MDEAATGRRSAWPKSRLGRHVRTGLLHQSLFEMAAAYLFHIARNHPFVDGNKRTALAAALVFLWLNDREIGAG